MKYLIKGIKQSGDVFRPSDWAERLASAVAQFCPSHRPVSTDSAKFHRSLGYSLDVIPKTVDGVKCILLDSNLEQTSLITFNFVLAFARDNDLVVVENYVKIPQVELPFNLHKECCESTYVE